MKTTNRFSLAVSAALALSACTFTTHPTRAERPTATKAPASWAEALQGPVTLEWEPVVSARWKVERAGLVNLERPEAKDLPRDEVDIVLPIHVLRHPTRGTFIIDTGVSQSLTDGQGGGVTWPVSTFTASMKPETSLKAVLARQPTPLSGVLFTHLHLDHVLGLPDVPAGTPLYTGPGETTPTSFQNLFLRATYSNLFAGQSPTTELDISAGVRVGEVERAIDFFGDGSLWVIAAPGHTPGSLAFLARTAQGPVLFAGDTCHTRWGWEHQVEPGTFTGDHAQNRASLAQLASLTKALPGLTVLTGHEIEPAPAVAQR
ncbi:MAG: MBL fold metallo-hydrolase [Myxococcaceae bacterium]|nr:MBL fold metallo-hydrolase [Myxococcaceae bacterium]